MKYLTMYEAFNSGKIFIYKGKLPNEDGHQARTGHAKRVRIDTEMFKCIECDQLFSIRNPANDTYEPKFILLEDIPRRNLPSWW